MEVLETTRVDAYMMHDVVVPAARRKSTLCVIWEGTCSERTIDVSNPRRSGMQSLNPILPDGSAKVAIWHAGDWTGPIALQPERHLSAESFTSTNHDVIAVSSEGVKVITIDFYSLHSILQKGSFLYRRYSERKANHERASMVEKHSEPQLSNTERLLHETMKTLNILELLNLNSALRKLTAVQKRHLESLAEGPTFYSSGERLWKAGATVDRAFVVVSGSASFVPKRRKADGSKAGDKGIDAVCDGIQDDGIQETEKRGDESSMSSVETDDQRRSFHYESLFQNHKDRQTDGDLADSRDFEKLTRGLQKRADYLQHEGGSVGDFSLEEESQITTTESQLDFTFTDDADPGLRSNRNSIIRRRSSRARFANKVLGRLYNRRAFTSGLVFSRGHFLGDVSKMVAGLLSHETASLDEEDEFNYGFGDKSERGGSDSLLENISELVIQEQETNQKLLHSSTLTAGKDGCVVLVFPKSSLIPFLDEHPGLLLSLLGTQVVV
jgi:hypothetical protein